jgi:hypothetical protein
MERIFYVPMPEDEFFRKIAEAAYAVFEEKKQMPSQTEGNTKWLNHQEAAAYIKKTPDALYKLTCSRTVKFTKRGKANFFLKTDLDVYMNGGWRKTAKELASESKLHRKNYLPNPKKIKNG